MKLYDLLPEYFRLFGDDRRLGEHLLQPTQDNLDEWEDAKQYFQLQLGLEFTTREWCLALQGWVGGYSTRDRWLVVGLNPEWDAYRMRHWLKNAWEYWGIKGTEPGFKKACDLWLDYHKPIRIWNPCPTRWHGWGDPYYEFQSTPFLEQKTWGGGDFPRSHTPTRWTELRSDWFWEWGQVWTCRNLKQSKATPIQESRSHLSPRRVWQEFSVDEDDWNDVAPHVPELNIEALPATVRGIPFVKYHQDARLDLQEQTGESLFEEVVTDIYHGFSWGTAYHFTGDRQVVLEESIEIIEGTTPSVMFGWGMPWGSVDRYVPEGDRSEVTEEIEEGGVGIDWLTPYPVVRSQVPESYTFEVWESQVGGDWQSVYGAGEPWQYAKTVSYTQELSLGFLTADWLSVYGEGFNWQSLITRETEANPWQSSDRIVYIETVIPGEPDFIAGIPTYGWWFNPPEAREIVTINEVEIPLECSPGISMEVTVGYQDEQLPSTPAILPTMSVKEVSEVVTTEVVPGYQGWVGRDWLSPWTSSSPPEFQPIDTYTIDLEAIAEIETQSIEIPASTQDGQALNWFTPSYDVPMWGLNSLANEVIESVTPAYFAIAPPELSFYWGDRYGSPKMYYCPGEDEIPGGIIQHPIVEQREICNLTTTWDNNIIFDRTVTEVEIPPEQLRPLERFLELRDARSQSRWKLSVELEDRLLVVEPSSLFALEEDGRRSTRIDINGGTRSLELEFFVHLGYSGTVRSLSLLLDGVGLIHYKQPIKQYLDFDRRVALGFQYSVFLSVLAGTR
jgi:hypothetical protein